MDDVSFRPPTVPDGWRVWDFIRSCGVLEPNSCYAYLLFCRDFADTCVVAERDGAIVGAVIGYRPPKRPEVVFVWQVGVGPTARGSGLGTRLLDALVDAPGCAGVRFLEATVTPSNGPSRALFEGFARKRGVPAELRSDFGEEAFGPLEHEREDRISIGPFGR